MSAVYIRYIVPAVLPQVPPETGSNLHCIPVVSNDSAEDNSIWVSKPGDKHKGGLGNEVIESWEDNKIIFPLVIITTKHTGQTDFWMD